MVYSLQFTRQQQELYVATYIEVILTKAITATTVQHLLPKQNQTNNCRFRFQEPRRYTVCSVGGKPSVGAEMFWRRYQEP